MVWGWLLILTGVEVFLAYEQLPLRVMLVLLMGLSLVKAALIMAYFMHLRFEKRTLILTLIPALIVVLRRWLSFSPIASGCCICGHGKRFAWRATAGIHEEQS